MSRRSGLRIVQVYEIWPVEQDPGGVIGNHAAMSEAHDAAPRRLVGRQTDIARVTELLAPGRPLLIAVLGEAGIGKSALLAVAAGSLIADGWEVIAGQAREGLDSSQCFAGSVLEHPIGDIGSNEDSLGALAEAAVEKPTCLLVDDVHWADTTTVRFLHSALVTARVPVVVAARRHPSPPHVSALIAEAHERIDLEGLTLASLVELADSRGAGRSPELERALARCGGNPLLAELIAEAHCDGSPDAVDDIVGQRLRELSAAGQHLLRTASLLGSKFVAEDLAALMGAPVASLLPAFDEVLAAGLIRPEASSFHFRHDVVRESVYGEIPEPLRKAMHREAAIILSSAGRPRLSLCDHYLASAAGTDEDAFVFVADTAREVTVGAPRVARDLLERALPLAPPGHPLVPHVQADLARALVWCGDSNRAVEVLRAALEKPRPPEAEFALRSRLIEALESLGKVDELSEELGARASIERLPERLRRTALVETIPAINGLEQVAEVDAIVEQAAVAGDLELEARGLAARYKLASQARDKDALPVLAERLIALADALAATGGPDALWPVGQAYWFWADAASRVPDFDTTLLRCRQGLRFAEASGAVGLLFVFQTGIAEALVMSGNWADAFVEAGSAVSLADDYGGRVQRVAPTGILAWIELQRGNVEAAESLLRETEGLPGPVYEGPWRVWTSALLAEARGNMLHAAELLASAGSPWVRPHAIRTAILAGRPDIVDALGPGSPSWRALPDAAALRCRAWIESDSTLMAQAAEMYAESMPEMERPSAAEDVATLLIRLGRQSDARAWLQRASEGWTELGATWALQRVHRALRHIGVRQPAPRARRRPAFGWDALTETESRVVGLTAQGLSNPEIAARLFVTRRTVTTHLSSAFRKLGVRRRTELAALVAARLQTQGE